ncbi:MAG: mechanosensitive ion channel family protein [Flavobacterium sp.]|jgi:small conductance mechanosensitive channel
MNDSLNITSLHDYLMSLFHLLLDYSPKLLAALLLFFVGGYTIRFINNLARKILMKREVEPTLVEFLCNVIFWALRIVLIIAVISKLGIESSSFVAILGAAGLAVGLSLQGSLANFAGGILIILFKPFKLGDTILAQNMEGTVIDIQIFVTQLQTDNNQVIFIPNGTLSNNTIINFSRKSTRRTDIPMVLPYHTSIPQARALILDVLAKNKAVLQQPSPAIIVKELTETGIKIAIRAWVKTPNYSSTVAEILEECLLQFEQNALHIQPYSLTENK